MAGGYFITGTDTGVGKTRVAAALLHLWRESGLRVAAMKPVASGCRQTADGWRNDDAERLLAECSDALDYDQVNPYAFEPAIAPHLAAADAGVAIDPDRIVAACRALAIRCDRLVVEGVGGWQVPLDERHTTADLARRLGLPVVVVVGVRLGCISHALLTVESVAASGLPLAGWVANRIDPQCLRPEAVVESLRRRIAAPCLGVVPCLEDPEPGNIASCIIPPE